MLWETYWINEMKILDKIVAHKKSEIDNLSSKIPILFNSFSFKQFE